MQLSLRKYKSLLFIYAFLVVILAVLPINSSGNAINHVFILSFRLDYLIHFVMYIPWAFLIWKITGASFRKNAGMVVFYIALGLVFAALTEGIQYFLPYRAFNINDMIGNGIGVLLGSVVFLF